MTNPIATMQRYDQFRRLMVAEGWLERLPTRKEGQPNARRYWDYPSGAMYDVTGALYFDGDDRPRKAATWEEYLARGETPPPF